jgi:hypothetical protein
MWLRLPITSHRYALYASKDLGRFDDSVAMALVATGITEPKQ